VRPPFVGDSPVAVAYQHVREEPQPPSVFDPEITPEMDAIVLRALVKDPDYRYQSADEMRADIEACLDGQPVAASAAMGSVGYGYGDDQPTTALRSSDAQATSMLPPMNPDDGGYGYDDRPDRRRQKKNNTSTILLVVAGVLVLIGAILIGKYAFSGKGTGGEAFKVPNFVSQTLAGAQKMAENRDLTLAPTRKPCAEEPKGNICSQEPPFGSTVNKGDTINVVVSTGAPKVSVPSVKGKTLDEAKQILGDDKYGFTVKTKYEESEEDPNTVLEQNPSLGDEVEKGSTITLTISKEKKQSVVPDVSRQSCEAAKAQMEANNLVGECVDTETDDQNLVGKVIQTTPTANTQADPGSKVQIQIGKAKQQSTVPNVFGRTVAEARQILGQAGFNNVQIAQGSDGSDDAKVISQDPGANNPVDSPDNTTVTLTTVKFGNNNGGNNGGGGLFGG
jgi:serine/threonine-protein kinase